MLGIKERVRIESGLRFSELFYLEMIIQWSTHARPQRRDLWKVGRSIVTANIDAVLLNCVSRHIRSLFEDYGLWKWPTEFSNDGTDSDSIHHCWDLRAAQMVELLAHKKLRLGSNMEKVLKYHIYEEWMTLEQRSNTRGCPLHKKLWMMYENPSFQLELHNGNYWVRNLIQSECKPDEHCHDNTILHTWFETVTENSGSDPIFRLKLIDQIKAENQANTAPLPTTADVLHSYFSPLSSAKHKLEEVFVASKAGLRVHILIQGKSWQFERLQK